MQSKKRIPLYAVCLVLCLLTFPAAAAAQWGGGYGGWHMGPGYGGYGMGWGWGYGWFGLIFMAVFWILVIVGLVYLIRWLAHGARSDRSGYHGSSGQRAIDILKERYARGEIDKAEFDAKKKDLMD